MQRKYLKTKRGYTIIETMIAISLFLVVIMTGITALLNANVVHQKSQDMRGEMDNLSFIMEDISRNLRTGSQYYCITGGDILSNVNSKKSGQNCWGVAFEAAPPNGDPTNANDQWVYYVGNDNAIWKSTNGPYNNPPTNFTQLTPSEVKINTISGFDVLGAEATPGDNQQPFVRIRLVGTVTTKGVVTPFSLETSVSQRLVDF